MKHPIDKRIYEANSALFSLASDPIRQTNRVSVTPDDAVPRPSGRLSRARRRTMAAAALLAVAAVVLVLSRSIGSPEKKTVSVSAPYAVPVMSHPQTPVVFSSAVSLRNLRVEPRWLPEGYEVTSRDLSDERELALTAQNEENEYIHIRVLAAQEAAYEETDSGQAVTVQGRDARMSTGPDGTEISWFVSELGLWVDALSSAAGEDDMLLVAENLDIREAAPPVETPSQTPEAPSDSYAADAPRSGSCGSNVTWRLSGSGILILSGSGPMQDYQEGHLDSDPDFFAPWRGFLDVITAVVIEEGVTTVGNEAFLACSQVRSVSLPRSLTYIGYRAFEGCQSLTSLDIPQGVTGIGADAFCGCRSLTGISLPDSVMSIGYNAFLNCKSLTSVVLPSGLTTIASGLFHGCSALTSVTIPEGVTTIENDAFAFCTSLHNVDIPNSVTYVSYWGMGDLTDIYFDGTMQQWYSILVDQNVLREDLRPTVHFLREDPTATPLPEVPENYNPWGPEGEYFPYPDDAEPPPTEEAPSAPAPDEGMAEPYDPPTALFEQYLQTGVPSGPDRALYHTEEGDVWLAWEEIEYYELYGSLPPSYYNRLE